MARLIIQQLQMHNNYKTTVRNNYFLINISMCIHIIQEQQKAFLLEF